MRAIRVAVLVGSLFAILGAYAWAQTFQLPPAGTISGNDIAFRVEQREGGRVVGRLMVRIDGKWVDADVMNSGRGGVVPLQSK